MSNFSHLLSKHGVLSSFNIARKIKTKDINKLKNNLIDDVQDDEDFMNKLNSMILLKEKNRSVDDIPGLIISNKEKSDMMIYFEGLPPHIKKVLVHISNYFAAKATEKKLSVPETLVAIQLIFNQLNIETQDLRDFNKMFNDRHPQDDIDDEEDDEDEDDEF